MWHNFIKKKPKKKGWYITTVEVKGQQRYTMALCWYPETQKFMNNTAAAVFHMYKVYAYDDDGNDVRMYSGEVCDRTNDVIVWRNMPKAYMKGFIKDYNLYI